ncbi:hypothetical protein RHOFW104T7_00885 [Rhodanobacter thiooxydans]|uniref:Copper-binding protein n=1 Tax=Rhodanobacter thiooxydans TaxID=416169 RepID=A0A154QF34_9GAMM|nr:hypothetical protein [Rhodanobacter thiooxydans]EIM00595.1 hypothetical protein UUA_06624 [Rhodanobacter thiooxydans LCS2]KZC22405.1 hypothetical protein RHOFW104T7_00885 [Rhodanobacter thiooxydans]
MTFLPRIIVSTAAVGLCLAFGTVSAQNTGGMAPASSSSGMGQMGGMHQQMMRHNKNGSMHIMPATVSSVDTKTGMVEADSEGMSLRLHFPPASVANLKAGDKITLHMGYTR